MRRQTDRQCCRVDIMGGASKCIRFLALAFAAWRYFLVTLRSHRTVRFVVPLCISTAMTSARSQHFAISDQVAPGSRWCRQCNEGPRWCCKCLCSGCSMPNHDCDCSVGDYEVHPFMASWDAAWHTLGYRRDFQNALGELKKTILSVVDAVQDSH